MSHPASKQLQKILLLETSTVCSLFLLVAVWISMFQMHLKHPHFSWIWGGLMGMVVCSRLMASKRTFRQKLLLPDALLALGWTLYGLVIPQSNDLSATGTLLMVSSLQVLSQPGASLRPNLLRLSPLFCLMVPLLWSLPENPHHLTLVVLLAGWTSGILLIQQHLRGNRKLALSRERSHQQALRQLQDAHNQLQLKNEHLECSRKRLQQALKSSQQMASTDVLTGCLNRRGMMQHLKQHFAPQTLQGALLLLDLDHFKKINDQHGHPFGDLVLKTMVERMEMLTRTGDVVVRYGGEEFLCILPGASLEDACTLAERLRQMVACAPVVEDGHSQWVTVSIGVTVFDAQEDLHTAIERADQAMYQAKGSGRNRVKVLSTPVQKTFRTVPPAMS